MLYGVAGTVIRVGGNILLLPLVLKVLPASEIALWWVFLALGGLASLADFGFGQALSRVYSYLWAGADDFDVEGLRPLSGNPEPNRPRLLQLSATARLIYTRLAWVAVFLLAVGGTAMIWPKAQASAQPALTWAAWGAYALAIGYSLGSSHWVFACQGTNRMRDFQASILWSGVLYFVSAAILLVAGCGLFAMVVATLLRAWLARWLCSRSFQQIVSPQPGPLPAPDFSMLKRLWPNAWKFGVLSLGAYLIFNSGVLISSRYLSDETTASYGLTAQVGAFLANLSALWLSVKWPQLTILRTQGKVEQMAVVFARRLTIMMGTFLVFGALLVSFGNRLLDWTGANTQLLSTPYLLVYLFYVGQQQFYAQFGTLTFTENVVPFYWISLFTGLGLAVLGTWMTTRMGLWGLILAPLIATAACSSWYPVWRGFRGQPLSVSQFFRAGLLGRV
jgi:O-antigen/teichoic acid export membrane protein